jgi:hypothetical protein
MVFLEEQMLIKRRSKRLGLPLPAQVVFPTGNADSWEEVTRLREVSIAGAGLSLNQPVPVGSLLCLTLSLPAQLRCFDRNRPQYSIWGLVRYILPHRYVEDNNPLKKKYYVGIAFIGKQPPVSFISNPSTLYDLDGVSHEGLWKVTEIEDLDQTGSFESFAAEEKPEYYH